MLVSVIVPVFNGSSFVSTALDSILKQSAENIDLEIVVINDGSTDNTAPILDARAAQDSRIKVFHFDNRGVSIARHRGIERASGEYLLFLDADDEMAPGLLNALKETIETYNAPDIIRFQAEMVNDDKHKDHNRYNCASLPLSSGPQALINWCSPSAKKYALFWLYAIKKKLFNIQFPNLNCHEDVAVLPVIIAKADTVVAIPFIGYRYTCNNQLSLTHPHTMDAKRSRARDFLAACEYVTNHFINLTHIGKITPEQLGIFIFNFAERKQAYYNTMPEVLQEEFSSDYGQIF